VKNIPAALQAHYESGATTLALLWRIERTDGQTFGFTDHDVPITFGGLTYAATSVFDGSALSTMAGLSVDNLELVGLLDSSGITNADIEAGLWDGAHVELRRVNWADLSMGAEIMRFGELGQVSRKRGQYVAEVRGLMQALQNNIGRVVTPSCDAQLGDSRCNVDLDGSPSYRESATVAAYDGEVTITATLQAADGWYTGGWLEFTSGANAGIGREVREHAASPSTVRLILPFPWAIAPGDAFTITAGCDHSKATCMSRFNNLMNFRGFSFVPGQTSVLKVGGQ
jgi:uncharacterized phage protein (TIGR02218 family)